MFELSCLSCKKTIFADIGDYINCSCGADMFVETFVYYEGDGTAFNEAPDLVYIESNN